LSSLPTCSSQSSYLNHDGQLSQQEADQIGQTIVHQVRMLQLPEPANSPTNLIESGRTAARGRPGPDVHGSGTAAQIARRRAAALTGRFHSSSR